MIREIERIELFRSDTDTDRFVERLAEIIEEPKVKERAVPMNLPVFS